MMTDVQFIIFFAFEIKLIYAIVPETYLIKVLGNSLLNRNRSLEQNPLVFLFLQVKAATKQITAIDNIFNPEIGR